MTRPGNQHLPLPLEGVVVLTRGPCHAENHRFSREEMPSLLELLQSSIDRLAHTEWPGFPATLLVHPCWQTVM